MDSRVAGYRANRMIAWLEKHQIWMYLAALFAGGVIGILLPGVSTPLEQAINPVLGLLLYATFLMVPLGRICQGFKYFHFLAVLGELNFLVVPFVVFSLTWFISSDRFLFV